MCCSTFGKQGGWLTTRSLMGRLPHTPVDRPRVAGTAVRALRPAIVCAIALRGLCVLVRVHGLAPSYQAAGPRSP